MRILTIDLGTSATKVALWSEDGPIAVGRATVDVEHPRPGWVEQDPETWWSSTLDACAQLPEDERAQVDAVGFSSQRDTFVPSRPPASPSGGRSRRPTAGRRDGRRTRPGLPGADGGRAGRRHRRSEGRVDPPARVRPVERRATPDHGTEGSRRVPADGPGRDRYDGRVTDRPARPGRSRPGRRRAPPGSGRPDDHHRQHPPDDGVFARRARRHAGRGRRWRSRVRAARRRGDDRPTDGVVGIDRGGVRPGRARPAARSGDRRLARRARRVRDGSGSLRGGVRARVARPAHRSPHPTISRTRPTRSTPALRDSSRWRGSVARAPRGGRRARGSRSPG